MKSPPKMCPPCPPDDFDGTENIGPYQAPLTVSVNDAGRLLSLGRTSVFALIRSGELDTFKCGRRRLISRQSIIDYVSRGLSQNR